MSVTTGPRCIGCGAVLYYARWLCGGCHEAAEKAEFPRTEWGRQRQADRDAARIKETDHE